jgi:1-acyl-sn-glycerol-3-phosphate acyltransferase
MFYNTAKKLLGPLLKALYRIRVTGQENEPDAPYITIANHSSFIDPAILACCLKNTQRFVARSTLSRFKVMNWLFNKARVITIKRGKSDVTAIRSIIGIIKNGDCVGIFPQGTRMRRVLPEPSQVEAGLGLLASATEVPVLPVSIVTKRLMPGIFHKTNVVIGKPIPASEYMNFCENPTKKQITEYCFTPVCDVFKNIDENKR